MGFLINLRFRGYDGVHQEIQKSPKIANSVNVGLCKIFSVPNLHLAYSASFVLEFLDWLLKLNHPPNLISIPILNNAAENSFLSFKFPSSYLFPSPPTLQLNNRTVQEEFVKEVKLQSAFTGINSSGPHKPLCNELKQF